MPALEQMHSVREVADAWGCSVGHIYGLIRHGALAAEDIADPDSRRSKLRITDTAIARFRGRIDPAGRPTLTLVPGEVA